MAWLVDRLTRFAATRLGRASDSMYRRAVQFVRFHDNFDYHPDRNGEFALLRTLRPFEPRIVFDVGANVGEWSIAAARLLPTAQVHAFEIVPDTAHRLIETSHGCDRVHVNPIGLSDAAGTVTVDVCDQDPTLSSIVQGATAIHRNQFAEVSCEITTGDAYCVSNNIDRIDLLKLDVEGAEGRVLAGFSGILERGCVDVIQFEYGMANIYSRFLLIDAYRMLGSRGFSIGKLFPDGVRFKPYHPADEDLRGPNYVAVSDKRPDLIASLKRFK